jgi:hypothetical protein
MMQWYYVKDDQQHGPVRGRELKRMARQGSLTRDDLVWRAGLSKWVACKKVEGLFKPRKHNGSPEAEESDPDHPLVALELDPEESHDAMDPPEPPSNSSSPPTSSGPKKPLSALLFPRRHPLDVALHGIRVLLGPDFVEKTITNLMILGNAGFYTAMLFWPFFVLAASWRFNHLDAERLPSMMHLSGLTTGLVLALGGIALLFVMQYLSKRFFDAMERMRESAAPARLNSDGPVDALALFALLGGVVLVVLLASFTRNYLMEPFGWSLIALTIALAVLSVFKAFFILSGEGVHQVLDRRSPPGEQFLSFLAFSLQIAETMTAACFGLIGGFATLLLALMGMASLVASPEMLPSIIFTGFSALGALLVVAFLPMASYFAQITLYFILAFFRNLLRNF